MALEVNPVVTETALSPSVGDWQEERERNRKNKGTPGVVSVGLCIISRFSLGVGLLSRRDSVGV